MPRLEFYFFLFPLDLIQVQRYSATAAGAAVLPFILLMFFLSRWSGGLVARNGPRVPLIAGPLIAALGFALFAKPSVGRAIVENVLFRRDCSGAWHGGYSRTTDHGCDELSQSETCGRSFRN